MTKEDIEKQYRKLYAEAESSGYYLNPDTDFAMELVKGLLVNEERYGYPSCPCRLANGQKEDDLDIICPCDYRDADVTEFGVCYCALYVSQAVRNGGQKPGSIPERRKPPAGAGSKPALDSEDSKPGRPADHLPLPVWRCKVCGYLCAREEPPEVCPICKAKKERFEKFM